MEVQEESIEVQEEAVIIFLPVPVSPTIF